jgi:choline dehydrogenase-like flavoprotein
VKASHVVLRIADAGVVPGSLGVKLQLTIMVLATRLAFALPGRPDPVEEPEPESVARPRITRVHEAVAA